MKKTIISALFILSVVFSASAQDQTVTNVMTTGTSMGSVGIGLPVFAAGYRMTIPPVTAFYEVGILDLGRPGSVAVGAQVGFLGYKINTGFSEVYYKHFNTLFGLRGAYHFTILNNWEVYAGTVLGIRIDSERFSPGVGSATTHTHLKFGWQILGGTRYMFTPSLGAFVEAGYGFTYATIGATYRF
ncbi:MAG: hypothetical protein WC377_09140 [Bacteroidales bacterium]|jgi:hypothetical protein|nr:hypothetical protein [Bacteroidales bacterium]MDD3101255.1 hypothetical protein [Bacteroidales bacterium]MDD3639993.1 hypothetical protein [Bacteroidales bacterium]MDD4481388.1 hypothetical protein [Bacteroidales bacterium]MDD5315123.1 hypothetical protein [Bacteroidales bacterium]